MYAIRSYYANTGMGAPFINFEFNENLNNEIEISVFPKGAGSENMSALKMLTPSEGLNGIKKFILETVANAGGKPCPPIVLGVGIGGTADISFVITSYSIHYTKLYEVFAWVLYNMISTSFTTFQGLEFYIIPIAIGYLSHIVGDCMTPMGCKASYNFV